MCQLGLARAAERAGQARQLALGPNVFGVPNLRDGLKLSKVSLKSGRVYKALKAPFRSIFDVLKYCSPVFSLKNNEVIGAPDIILSYAREFSQPP